MKKIIVITSILLMGYAGKAQTINGIKMSELDKKYVIIRGVQKGFSATKLTITLDFGQNDNIWKTNKTMTVRDKEGKKIVFLGMADALNFLAKYGYKLNSAIAIQGVYEFIMEKTEI